MIRIVPIIIYFFTSFGIAQITIKDSETKAAISYAAISFGNGYGLFADDDGKFVFIKKIYPDVDSLFISALGYHKEGFSTKNLPNELLMRPKLSEIDEVVITVRPNRKLKLEKVKPYLDDDYYKCWLPTIESEIAVFFPNESNKPKSISSVLFPIALESRDWKKRKRSNADKRKFSTLFKVMFYENRNGFPGNALNTETIVFRTTEKNGDVYELNVDDYNLMVPKDGFFVSIQVLGYTDKNGKLLSNKKYKEIESKKGIVKIPTNFRPLLPFTDKINTHRTFVRRVFIQNNQWRQFKKGNGFKSNLLGQGLTNYGVGVTYKIYKNE